MIFNDILLSKDGMIKGPFGSAVKKSLFVPKDKNTYKVYEQSVVANNDYSVGNYYLPKNYVDKSLSRFFIQPGDILMTGAGTLGLLSIVPTNIEPGIMNQALIRIRLNEKVIYKPYFMYYFPWSIKKVATRINGDSVIPNLPPLDVLKKIEISIPPMKEQCSIADSLNIIDSKIANNASICSDLESMAKLLYDYWFVQFDFPDVNGRPYKSSGGKMVWNEELKREIPVGWKVKDILDVCNIVDCLHSKKPEYCYESDDCYLLTLENLTKEGHIDLSKKFYISRYDYKTWTSKIEVHEGDFVITNAGRAGDIGRIPQNVKCAIGRNLTAIRPINIDSIYLHMFLKSPYVRTQIESNLDQGAFFSSFNVHAIRKLKILVPDSLLMTRFVSLFHDNITCVEGLQAENQQLTSLRDFLLPMLMNGQVKVKN